ncbi:MAG TPA: hypothetical protein PLO24_05165 [Bacteroidales bacterium]|jgi:hypothetical protein|nr:hypothetical protein [Bacteroidales bacterium]HOS71521.1 hypothetical protein [Bacteroidales bacterium]HQH23362.1 hypothetical protein [Bacteroidales bacterium]HQJ81393.1 hypothetical protein [Bacteroidales bacterium]
MRKNICLLFVLLALSACKKEKWEPEGPTDVRIRNLQTDELMADVVINTAGVRDTVGNVKKLGMVKPGRTSEYRRVSIAFPKAEITAEINGETFSTGPVNSTYMHYIGLMRITYEVQIKDPEKRLLEIKNIIPDEALKP